MKRLALLVFPGLFWLGGCANPTPSQATAINITCRTEAFASPTLAVAEAVASIAVPEFVAAIAAVQEADRILHPAVQQVCASLLPGSKPVSASVQ
jgi:hypothetical protein